MLRSSVSALVPAGLPAMAGIVNRSFPMAAATWRPGNHKMSRS
jgi:hypothetical protein